jgi:hypothetical protein
MRKILIILLLSLLAFSARAQIIVRYTPASINYPFISMTTSIVDYETDVVSINAKVNGDCNISWGDESIDVLISDPVCGAPINYNNHSYLSNGEYNITLSTTDNTFVCLNISSSNLTYFNARGVSSLLLRLSLDGNLLSSIDMVNFTNLTNLTVSDNSISSFSVSGCDKLAVVNIMLNNLTEVEVDNFISSLPDRTSLVVGSYDIVPQNEGYLTELTAGQISALSAKNWASAPH